MSGDPIAAAAELGQAELAIERPEHPLDQANAQGASAQEAGEAAPAVAAFTREDLNAFAREIVTFGRQLIAPKAKAWDIQPQELDNLGRTGGALLEKWMPADLGPYTVEIAFGLAVVGYVTRAAREDAAARRAVTEKQPVTMPEPSVN